MADKHANLQRIDPFDESSYPIYYGYAKPGSLDDENVWSLRKVVNDSGVRKYLYPYLSGRTHLDYNLNWNSRATYYYQ